ncbi:large ribosomal subunit protein eL14-like [Bolinopsis microptera]|uniref:large ribosomal subunit protein eL14-like n=1 Tax=Bolinopsis microptera TaxID=2820187 RepID=UPI00307B0DEE
MLYQRKIEIGRVCYVRLGENAGKTGVVVDLVDQKHLLIDGPDSGLARSVFRLNQIAITDLKVKIPRGCKTKVVRAALAKDDIPAKFLKSGLSKKSEAQQAKAALGDFARFKLRVSKTAHNRKIRSTVRKLKKSS